MITEVCPVFGEFCRTTCASLQISSHEQIIPKETLMSQNIENSSRSRLIPIRQFIDHLKDAEQVLKGCKTHPGDATLVCISSDQACDLEVILVRLDRKQKDWISYDLLAEAEAEIATRQSALARLRPVVSKAKDGTLSAEELLTAFKAEHDPKVARERFLAMKGDRTTLRDEHNVLVPSSFKPLPKTYAAKSSYVLNVLVTSIDKTSADARLIVIDLDLTDAIFSSADSGVTGINTRVPDADDLRCLNLCMAYDVSVTVELAISVIISVAGIGYIATLIRIVNPTETLRILKQSIAVRLEAPLELQY